MKKQLMLFQFDKFKSPVIIGAFFISFLYYSLGAHNIDNQLYSNIFQKSNNQFPNPLKKFFLKQKHNHKIAAALAFPFPFGCVGLHRVYLGTASHVPIAYAASAGGIFGIVPLIDCIVLLSHSDVSEYTNNPRVIMWIKHNSSEE
jgi:hypothetical protein